MAPTSSINDGPWRRATDTNGEGRSSLTTSGLILESWGEGYQVGSLIILMLIVVCNYRRHVVLHKLILLEMFLALWHGTFIFLPDPTYGWYLSGTALLLFISYQIHNIVAYLKIKPFMPRWGRWVFIITLACVQPFWVIEAWDNFEYFNGSITWNIYTRPWEALFRDPWWIFTTYYLIYKLKVQYEFSFRGLLQTNSRLVVMLLCMILSIAFLLADVIVTAAKLTQDAGINPYWRLSLVFKAASDTIFLDDFKSVLDSIIQRRFSEFHMSSRRNGYGKDRSLSTRPRSRSPKSSGNELTIQLSEQQDDPVGPKTTTTISANSADPPLGQTKGRQGSVSRARAYQGDREWGAPPRAHSPVAAHFPSSHHAETATVSPLDSGSEVYIRMPPRTTSQTRGRKASAA